MKNKTLKSFFVLMLLSLMLMSTAAITTGCGSSDSFTAQDLQNARSKKANGEKLTRSESNMVEGFEKWKADQDRYAD